MNHSCSFLRLRFLLVAVFNLTLIAPAFAQWPQWGGENMDFKADAKGLANSWPETGPKQLWKRDLGDGYSSIVVDGGRLIPFRFFLNSSDLLCGHLDPPQARRHPPPPKSISTKASRGAS